MLEKLHDVQTRDLELDALDAQKHQTPQALLDTRAEHRALQARLEEKRQQLEQLRKEVRANELELEALQDRRKSAAAASLAASSAKEAAQYQNQELQFATRVEELEGDTLPLMERLEGLQNEVAALESEMAELQPRLDALSAEEEARLNALEREVEHLRRLRDALAGEIDPALLKQYEQVRRSRRGVGLALVVDGQRCGGCNVLLPIHILQKVKRGGVTRCPSCGRILWYQE